MTAPCCLDSTQTVHLPEFRRGRPVCLGSIWQSIRKERFAKSTPKLQLNLPAKKVRPGKESPKRGNTTESIII